MFRGDLLIDGYNLLHAAGLARRTYGPGEFEKTRRRLLKLLASQLLDRERQRTTVVFDAPEQSLGPSPPSLVYGIRVMFAGGDGDADAEIERLIRLNSAPKRLHVISSDHRVQKAARRRRAKFFDSETFLRRIARRPTPEERAQLAEPPEKREGLTAPGEVDAWLQAFADVDDVIQSDPPPRFIRSKPSPDDPVSENPTEAKPTSSSDTSGAEKESQHLPNELTFWEQRIAELWERTDDP